MKAWKKIAVLMSCAVCLCGLPMLVQAAEMPSQLSAMIAELNECEEGFRDGEFAEAQESLEEINELYGEIVPQLIQVVDPGLVAAFPQASEELEQALASQNGELAERNFRNLSHLVISYTGPFDAHGSPQLNFIAVQLEESDEALESGDLGDFSEELEEIGEYLVGVREDILAQGVPADKIDALANMMEKLETMAAEGDAEAMKSILVEAKDLIEEMQAGL